VVKCAPCVLEQSGRSDRPVAGLVLGPSVSSVPLHEHRDPPARGPTVSWLQIRGEKHASILVYVCLMPFGLTAYFVCVEIIS
jgi:hypothetical protein